MVDKETTAVIFTEQEQDIITKGLDAIVQTGDYASREVILREAFTLFLLTHPQQRLSMSIQLYQDEVVTLSRAAELAGLNFFDFESLLKARKIEILAPDETTQEIRQGVTLILGQP
jgi:predicted HTH domain antitoxin